MGTADDANTWHELADQGQLLPEHVSVLHAIESALQQQAGLTDDERRLELLRRAREFAQFATSSLVFPDVPFPPEAGRVSAWNFDEQGDTWQRAYEGRECKAGSASVQICGTQRLDGAVIERKLAIHVGEPLTVDLARQFASLLGAEADEIERLNAS